MPSEKVEKIVNRAGFILMITILIIVAITFTAMAVQVTAEEDEFLRSHPECRENYPKCK